MDFRLIFMFVALLPALASADCANDPAEIKLALTPEALSVRNALFSKLCASPGVQLVDVTDKTLGKRLEPPGKWTMSYLPLTDNHGRLIPYGLQGTVLLAYVVNVDGSTHDVTVVEGSGNPVIDQAARRSWQYMKFQSPGRLDGHPVRVLAYHKMSIDTTGHQVFRPAHQADGH